ncbi:hypothetical protein SLEP1_g22700 [Rubroshorea leprosula]|uniref:Uncharacterized protein n=1 Tax=Rubroshorea leprosula TaxID=152421 RepID=A0AAV5J9Z8_9ROSI|nr:hypothetical protein SLEP1_g22700 [Rubroshorea leprosula]
MVASSRSDQSCDHIFPCKYSGYISEPVRDKTVF